MQILPSPYGNLAAVKEVPPSGLGSFQQQGSVEESDYVDRPLPRDSNSDTSDPVPKEDIEESNVCSDSTKGKAENQQSDAEQSDVEQSEDPKDKAQVYNKSFNEVDLDPSGKSIDGCKCSQPKCDDQEDK